MKKLTSLLFTLGILGTVLAQAPIVEHYSTGEVMTKKSYDASCKCYDVKQYYQDGKLAVQYKELKDSGKKMGKEEAFNENGIKQYSTHWQNGKRHGAYTSYYEDGKTYFEATYSQGARSGTWKFYEPDGSLYMEMANTTGSSNSSLENSVRSYFHQNEVYLTEKYENGMQVDNTVVNETVYNEFMEQQRAEAEALKLNPPK